MVSSSNLSPLASDEKQTPKNNKNLIIYPHPEDSQPGGNYMEKVENFHELISTSLANSSIYSDKKIVSGIITRINQKKGLVFVDVGIKSEGVIPIEEFFKAGEKESLAVGVTVQVYLSKIDTYNENISISRAKAIREESWHRIRHSYQHGHVIHGVCFSRVKGGLSVDLEGVVAFLPGSQIDVRPVKDISNIVGRVLPYKILSAEPNSRTVILSRKAILELEKSDDRDRFLEQVEVGQIMKGVVKNITHYGAFIDLDQVDGLLHMTDMVWDKISHPSEKLALGQVIQVKIIKYDKETKRLSLGMKQLLENPWLQLQNKYYVGKIVTGKVVNITTYGVFLQLDDGIEGLLHISEMSWVKDSYKKHKAIQLGQEIEASIIEVDMDKHRIALSIKQLAENPWEKFARNHNTGEILDGIVKNVTDFGIFVGIEGEEIDGLVHVSDLAWSGDSAAATSKYVKDDRIKVIYLGSDLANQRIRFGVKQLTNDPFEQYKDLVTKDKILTCKITAIKNDGIEVEIFGSIKSFIKKPNLARERIEQRIDKFAVGDKVDAKVVQYDPESRKLTLSIKALEEDDHTRTLQQYGGTDTGATIGNILGEALKAANERNENN